MSTTVAIAEANEKVEFNEAIGGEKSTSREFDNEGSKGGASSKYLIIKDMSWEEIESQTQLKLAPAKTNHRSPIR